MNTGMTTTHKTIGFVIASAAMILAGCKSAGKPLANDVPIQLVDITEKSGLNHTWTIEGNRPLTILQTIGHGVGMLDYNRDGNLDILLVDKQPKLYKGNGNGAFDDVTASLNAPRGTYLGCAIGDIDNDGFPDIYLTAYRGGSMLRNMAGSKFANVTSMNIPAQAWATTAAFAQLKPTDGNLSLYVGNYAEFGPTTDPQLCRAKASTGEWIYTSCGPRYYKASPGYLYQNDGQGKFIDVSKAVGMRLASGKALGSGFADLDDDGYPELALANDELPGDLMVPQPKAKSFVYQNTAETSGTAYDRDGKRHGGMGIAWGDYDGDLNMDLFVATFRNETKNLYRNEGGRFFTDMASQTQLEAAMRPFVAFGSRFLDVDSDGNLDLIVANGHVQDNIHEIDVSQTYRQKTQLFHHSGAKVAQFEDVCAKIPSLSREIVGRGLATGDIDNDGLPDILIADAEGRPTLLHNQSKRMGNWLGIQLVGTKSNRDGYGAKLTLTLSNGKKILRHCHTDGSYMSASDPRILFGIPHGVRATNMSIKWPSGITQNIVTLNENSYTTIREAVN